MLEFFVKHRCSSRVGVRNGGMSSFMDEALGVCSGQLVSVTVCITPFQFPPRYAVAYLSSGLPLGRFHTKIDEWRTDAGRTTNVVGNPSVRSDNFWMVVLWHNVARVRARDTKCATLLARQQRLKFKLRKYLREQLVVSVFIIKVFRPTHPPQRCMGLVLVLNLC